MDNFIFYKNVSGSIAVSIDDGESIFLPTGRRIAPTDLWEETEEMVTIDKITMATQNAVRDAIEDNEAAAKALEARKINDPIEVRRDAENRQEVVDLLRHFRRLVGPAPRGFNHKF